MKSIKLLVVLLPLLLLYCKEDSTGPVDVDYSTVTDISYNDHVQVILNEYETLLNDAGIFPAGLEMDSWENLIKGWNQGEVIIPFDADRSLLIELTEKLENDTELRDDKLDLLKRWIDEGARNDANEVPYANSQNRLYVCSQGAGLVSIIDVDAQVVIRNVDLTDFGLPVSAKPHHIAVAPDGESWFVSCIDNQVNKVLKFDANNELVGEITTDIPALLAYHPADDILYASRFMNNSELFSIFAIDAETMTPVSSGSASNGDILLPSPIPHGLTIGRDGNFIYTASLSENQIMIVNHNTKEFEESISLGDNKTPLQMTTSLDNNTLYVSCIGSNEIAKIDLATRTLDGFIAAGTQPWHSVPSHDGQEIYWANLGGNQFSVFNVASEEVASYGAADGSDGLAESHGIALSADGEYLFISNRNTSGAYTPNYDFGDNSKTGTVSVIETATRQVVKVIEIEAFGSGMTIWSAPN